MVMPSASLTLTDKVLIQMASGFLFLLSFFWYEHERIRSIGISYFPLAFCLFCKYARPFASAETRQRLFQERKEDKLKASTNEFYYEDPLDDPDFETKCLVWSVAQLVCVGSGVLNLYPHVIVKGALVFHILMTVQDSIETRPMVLHQEELKRKRKEKLQLESALFWKFLLPYVLWKLLGYQAVVDKATDRKQKQKGQKDKDSTADNPKQGIQPEKLIRKVRITKNVVSGKRETAVEDLIWGGLQIAYVVLDWTEKQAIGTAFMVYLCTLLEDVLLVAVESQQGGADGDDDDPAAKKKKKPKKINWFKLSWILLCLYLNANWFLVS